MKPQDGHWLTPSSPGVAIFPIRLSSSDRRVPRAYDLLIISHALQVSLDQDHSFLRLMYPQWFLPKSCVIGVTIVEHQQYAMGRARPSLKIDFMRGASKDDVVVVPVNGPVAPVLDALGQTGWSVQRDV
jgi:hypothetical protein